MLLHAVPNWVRNFVGRESYATILRTKIDAPYIQATATDGCSSFDYLCISFPSNFTIKFIRSRLKISPHIQNKHMHPNSVRVVGLNLHCTLVQIFYCHNGIEFSSRNVERRAPCVVVQRRTDS